jgi:hypothetical protein
MTNIDQTEDLSEPDLIDRIAHEPFRRQSLQQELKKEVRMEGEYDHSFSL